MPVSDEPLKEKIPFDVYSMLLIIGFLATAGAVAFLNDELQNHWYAGEQPGVVDHAEHITTLNSLLEDRENWYKYLTDDNIITLSTEIEVTETDLEDYKHIVALDPEHAEADLTPDEYTPYPSYINPIDNPVDTTPGHDNTKDVPPEVLAKMLEDHIKMENGLQVDAEGGDVEAEMPPAEAEAAPDTPPGDAAE